MIDVERSLSVEEAAEFLSYTPEKLQRIARRKLIAHSRDGRTVTFTLAALVEYRDRLTIAALPPNPHGLTNAAAKRVRA